MKILLSPLLTLTIMTCGQVFAQGISTTPTAYTPAPPLTSGEREEASGNISEITPGQSLVLHTGMKEGEPTVFRLAPQVTYVDADGKTVEAAGLRKNLRVRVSYVKTKGANIVDRVTILE